MNEKITDYDTLITRAADYLKTKGWNVIHIMALNKLVEHPYTSPAKVVDGKLSYQSV